MKANMAKDNYEIKNNYKIKPKTTMLCTNDKLETPAKHSKSLKY